MKDELIKAVTPLLQQFKDDVFALSEVVHLNFPILVEEIYRWEFVTSLLFSLSLGLPILLAGCFLLWVSFAKDWADASDGASLAGAAVLFGSGTAILLAGATWLQILIAPKLFLVEYIRGLV